MIRILSILVLLFSGGPHLYAQVDSARVAELAGERSWERLRQPAHASYFRYQGWVLDQIDLGPVERAAVKVLVRGKIIDAALTDTEGHFELQIPWAWLERRPLKLQVSFLGRTAGELELPLDTDELVVLADVELLQATVPITEEASRVREPSPNPQPCPRAIEYMTVTRRPTQMILYRPLDEWLMMHHSEIKHTGRW
ncbi:MAG: hypothetical protein AAGN35_14955 [Bacteroidota bacterium]